MDYKYFSKRNLKIGRDEIIIEKGIPQGSCLSPVLFNLYTEKLYNIEDQMTSIYQFIDDFIILSCHKGFDVAVANLQQKYKF